MAVARRVAAAGGRLAGISARWPGATLTLGLALAVLGLVLAITQLEVETDTAEMIAADTQYRQNWEAFQAAFDAPEDVLVAVVEADSPATARRGAARMVELLAHRAPPALARVFWAPGTDYFRRNGLLYLDPEALDRVLSRLVAAQPLINALARDPTLPGLFGLLAQGFEHGAGAEMAGAGTAGAEMAGSEIATLLDRLARAAREARRGEAAPVAWTEMLGLNEPGAAMRAADSAAPGPVSRELITLVPAAPEGGVGAARDAIEAARSAAAAALPAEARLRLTGPVALEYEELSSALTGARRAALASAVLVGLLLLLGLPRPGLAPVLLVTLGMGLAWTAGLVALLFGALGMISVAFAVLFIGLGVDFAIHFALRDQEASERRRRKFGSRRLHLAATGRRMAAPLSLAALAAAIGFLAFAGSDFAGLSELGLIAAMSMGIALLASLTVLPAMMAWLPPRVMRSRGWRPSGAGPVGRLVRGLETRPFRVILPAMVLWGAAALVAPGVEFDLDPLALKDPEAPAMRALADLERDPRLGVQAAYVKVADRAQARALGRRLADQPLVGGTRTIHDMLPDGWREKRARIEEVALTFTPLFMAPGGGDGGGDGAGGADDVARRAAVSDLRVALGRARRAGHLNDMAAAAARRLERALDGLDARALDELARATTAQLPALLGQLRDALSPGAPRIEALPDFLRVREIARDGGLRLTIRPARPLSGAGEMRAFAAQITAIAPQATGGPVVIAAAGEVVAAAVQRSLIVAALGIGLLLLAARLRPGEIASLLIALGFAGTALLAVMAISGLTFNFANVIALPLLLGLGVASAIHVVLRARQLGLPTPATGEIGAGARDFTRTSTPRAVLLSALTTIGSFGTLALSPHRGTASMGVLLTLAVGLMLIAVLGLLPSLLSAEAAGWWPGRGHMPRRRR